MLKKIYVLVIVFGFFIVLAGCGKSTEEKMYNHLEEAVTKENDFAKAQDQITELEDQENKIYDKIMELGMDDFKQIQKLSADAKKNIDDRSQKLKTEHESVEESKEEFKKTKSLISDIKEDKTRGKADEMYGLMMKRYKAYGKLHQSYKQSLKQEKQLYGVLQKKDSTQEELTKSIKNLNHSYDSVIAANKSFNEYTDNYNKAKKSFYKNSDLKVTYDDESK